MAFQIFRNLGIASVLGVGVLFGASPAKAITYSFSGTSTFSCNDPGFGDTCELSFNDFTADWDGGSWSLPDRSIFNTLTITNNTSGGSFSIDTFNGSILVGSGASVLAFSQGSNLLALSFSSPAPNPASVPSLLTIQSIDINASDTKFDTNSFATLTPNAQAYAAPYFASAFSLIPMLAASKRIKRRVLSA